MDEQRRQEIEEEERLRAEIRAGITADADRRPAYVLGAILLGAATGLIGSFSAWITANIAFAGHISRSGIDDGGDGWFTLALSICVGVVGLLAYSKRSRRYAYGTVVASAALLILTIWEWHDVQDRIDRIEPGLKKFGTVSVGTGIWLLLVGAIIALAAAIFSVYLTSPKSGTMLRPSRPPGSRRA